MTSLQCQCSIWYTENGRPECTCGWDLATGTTDIGDVTNWPLFPIVSLHLGDTGDDGEYVYFRIGPLVCKQGLFDPWSLVQWGMSSGVQSLRLPSW